MLLRLLRMLFIIYQLIRYKTNELTSVTNWIHFADSLNIVLLDSEQLCQKNTKLFPSCELKWNLRKFILSAIYIKSYADR